MNESTDTLLLCTNHKLYQVMLKFVEKKLLKNIMSVDLLKLGQGL
jgi:hypothetical protein